MSSTALVDRVRWTATTIRPPDPRRTNYTTIDFEHQDYEGELTGPEYGGLVDPAHWVSAGVHDWLSFSTMCQAALFATYADYHPDRSSDFDALTGTSQIELFGSRIGAMYSAGTAFEGNWSLGAEVSESLFALTATCDSVSAGLNSWSVLYSNAIKQIATAVMFWDTRKTVSWGSELFDRMEELTVLDLEIGTELSNYIEQIANFAQLEPDWDSYGAKSPTIEALKAASHYLQALVSEYSSVVGIRALPFWVYPLPSGGVKLEWREPESELEVEIDPEGNLRYLLQTGHGREADFNEQEEASLAEVREILGRVLVA